MFTDQLPDKINPREIVSLRLVEDAVVEIFPPRVIEFPPKVKLPKVPNVALPVLEKVIFPITAPVNVLFAVMLLLPVKMRLFVGAAALVAFIASVAFIRDVDQFPLTLEELVVRVLFHVKLPAA